MKATHVFAEACCPGTTLASQYICAHLSVPASFVTPAFVCRIHAETVYGMQSEEGYQPLELAVSANKSLVHAMVNTDVNTGGLCQSPLLFLSRIAVGNHKPKMFARREFANRCWRLHKQGVRSKMQGHFLHSNNLKVSILLSEYASQVLLLC